MQLSQHDCPVCVGHLEIYKAPHDKRPYFVCFRCNTKGDEKVLPFIVCTHGDDWEPKPRASRKGKGRREQQAYLC